MRRQQREFVNLCLELEALRFGDFTLKSGRESPYFFDAGRFCSGASLLKLGRHYAQAVTHADIRFDMLFGPAYKGIPLVATVAIAFAELFDRDVPYAFDRKERKDHGEGGLIVGAPLSGRVLVIDDVISAGTSSRAAAELIADAGASVAGLAIALDRQERGRGERSAVEEVSAQIEAPVTSIICLDDLITFLGGRAGQGELRQRMQDYRRRYGAPATLTTPG